MIEPRYLKFVAFGILLWTAAFFAYTLVIDPYGVSPWRVTLERVNQYKPKRVDIDRLIKPYEVWRYQPRTVFLGTSRIHQSMDPAALDGTPFAPAYNASIPASSLGMNIAHLQQYLELDDRLDTVIVELFLYNFLGQGQERAPKTLTEYALNVATLFVSADALWAATQTWFHNYKRGVPVYEITPGGYFYYPPGHNAKGPFDGYPAGIWQLHASRADGMRLNEAAFESVRELVRLARSHGKNIVFLLTPNHAYDDYYIDAIGEWRTVEEWIRRLSAEATVYSYSQPNDWVYEPVSEHMRYWNDPYHFTLAMGRAIELTLAGKAVPEAPPNFMVRMTPELAHAHVEGRRRAIRAWAQRHPHYVARFQEERSKWEAARAAAKR